MYPLGFFSKWKRLLLLSITTMKMDNKLLLLAAPPPPSTGPHSPVFLTPIRGNGDEPGHKSERSKSVHITIGNIDLLDFHSHHKGK